MLLTAPPSNFAALNAAAISWQIATQARGPTLAWMPRSVTISTARSASQINEYTCSAGYPKFATAITARARVPFPKGQWWNGRGSLELPSVKIGRACIALARSSHLGTRYGSVREVSVRWRTSRTTTVAVRRAGVGRRWANCKQGHLAQTLWAGVGVSMLRRRWPIPPLTVTAAAWWIFGNRGLDVVLSMAWRFQARGLGSRPWESPVATHALHHAQRYRGASRHDVAWGGSSLAADPNAGLVVPHHRRLHACGRLLPPYRCSIRSPSEASTASRGTHPECLR